MQLIICHSYLQNAERERQKLPGRIIKSWERTVRRKEQWRGAWSQGEAETEEYPDAADEPTEEPPEEVGSMGKETTFVTTSAATMATETFIESTNSTLLDEEDHQLEFILTVLIPLILLAILFLSVVFIMIKYKRKKAKQEASIQGPQSVFQTYELGSDNLKLPIFEEDTPSVMEIEVEELDKWMNNMNRDADGECLPTLKEEKESNHNPSDNES